MKKKKKKINCKTHELPQWTLQSPVILRDGSQQLPAGTCVEAGDTTRCLLDLGHLVLILKVDGLC